MDAEPNTAQGDELKALSLLIHAYEEKHFPIGNSLAQRERPRKSESASGAI